MFKTSAGTMSILSTIISILQLMLVSTVALGDLAYAQGNLFKNMNAKILREVCKLE
jgi:hypothetical protein